RAPTRSTRRGRTDRPSGRREPRGRPGLHAMRRADAPPRRRRTPRRSVPPPAQGLTARRGSRVEARCATALRPPCCRSRGAAIADSGWLMASRDTTLGRAGIDAGRTAARPSHAAAARARLLRAAWVTPGIAAAAFAALYIALAVVFSHPAVRPGSDAY